MRLSALMMACGLCLHSLPLRAQEDPYKLSVQVQQNGSTFETRASFQLPLSPCQAWSYITNYDAATHIPGVVSSKSTRQPDGHVRVERELKETILFFPIRMHTVLDFTETPAQSTRFVQVEGETKSHQGSWQLEPAGEETVFHYQAKSVPDTALPMPVSYTHLTLPTKRIV